MTLVLFAESTAAVCQFYNSTDGSECQQGASCPFRHIRGDRTIVCKHWLRGLCKKGDQCEFLHEYDMTKMPECYFYSRFNACHNKECPFLHIDPESKIKDCPWYDRGFCRHGPNCRHRHIRRVLCTNYLAGFCPDGTTCKYMHPRFELPPVPEIAKDQQQKRAPTCHFCGEVGHKASYCQKMPPEVCTMLFPSFGCRRQLLINGMRSSHFSFVCSNGKPQCAKKKPNIDRWVISNSKFLMLIIMNHMHNSNSSHRHVVHHGHLKRLHAINVAPKDIMPTNAQRATWHFYHQITI